MGPNSNTYNYGQCFDPPYMPSTSTPNHIDNIDKPLIPNHHSQSTGWSIQYRIGIPMISCWNITDFTSSRGDATSRRYTITVFGSFLSKFRFAYPMSVYG